MNIIIKKAELEDLKTIQQFGYQLLKYEKDNWDKSLEIDWPFSDEGKAAYSTRNIFVNPNKRRYGVGEKLALSFKKHCVSNNVNKINVTVNAKNEGAIKFYKKINLVPSRIILSQEL